MYDYFLLTLNKISKALSTIWMSAPGTTPSKSYTQAMILGTEKLPFRLHVKYMIRIISDATNQITPKSNPIQSILFFSILTS